MADQANDGLEVKCTRCRRVTKYTDAMIKAKLSEEQIIYREVLPTEGKLVDIKLSCPICGQENVVTIRHKPAP